MAGILANPAALQFLAHVVQGIGTPQGPDISGGLLMATQMKNRQEKEDMYRRSLGEMDLNPQQRGILSMLPPQQGAGILAQQAFAQNKQVPGRDVPYSPEVLEQQMALRGRGPGMGGETEFGVSPLFFRRPDGSIGVAQLSKAGGAQPVSGLPEGAVPIRPAMRVGGGLYDPLSAQRRTDVTGDIASGKAAETQGTAIGTARSKMPMAEADTKVALETIKKLRKHPGRVHGWGARVPDWAVNPNSPEMEFRLLNEQARNQTFIQAFQRLKGGGHITEIEGTKASEAMERLERAQSRESYNRALSDLERIYKIGLARARREARMGGSSSNVPRETIPNEAGGEDDIDSLINQYRSR